MDLEIEGRDIITIAWTIRPGRYLTLRPAIIAALLNRNGKIPSLDDAAFPGQPSTACGSVRLMDILEDIPYRPSLHIPKDPEEIFLEGFEVDLDRVSEAIDQIAFMFHIEDARNSAFSTDNVEDLTVLAPRFIKTLPAAGEAGLSRWIAVLKRDAGSRSGWSIAACEGTEKQEGYDVLQGLLERAPA